MPTYATSVMASGSHGKSFEVQHRARHSDFFGGNVGLTCFIAIVAEYFERPMNSDFYGQAAPNLNSAFRPCIRATKAFVCFRPRMTNKGGACGFPH
jgi:hypothetical protein